ncbi:MAG: acyclic terpene utilization AtuA family protein, partial [Pyrinomonadaceae bacterium]
GHNRVRVHGIKGHPATEFLKVSISYSAGFKAVGTLVYSWPDAYAKAQAADKILRARLERLGLHFDQILTEFVGVNATHALSWRRRSSEIIADCRVFQVRRDVSVSPHRGSEHDFFVLESSDWINIIPLTANDEVVMIEQYRHGSKEVTLEIPGGMVDAGESPKDAAAREMLEE